MFYSPLILPGSALYEETLANTWTFLHSQNPTGYYVVDAETGLQRAATLDEVQEYVFGGEYDAVMEEEENELD